MHLALSPSDGALKSSATSDAIPPQIIQGGNTVERIEPEDRGHMSDGEIVPASKMRRRLFGRSNDSAGSSIRRLSKDLSPMGSPIGAIIPDKDKEREKDRDKESVSSAGKHSRSKKSVDGGNRAGERLSIFGGTFTGSLGKNRKPPPRCVYSQH